MVTAEDGEHDGLPEGSLFDVVATGIVGLVPEAGKTLSTVLLAELVILLLVVNSPKLLLGVVVMGVEPLEATELANLLLDVAVILDEALEGSGTDGVLVKRPGGSLETPETDVDNGLVGVETVGEMKGGLGLGLNGAEPHGVDVNGVVGPLEELLNVLLGNSQVLDDEGVGATAVMHGAVQVASVHEGVHEEAREAVEQRRLLAVRSHPEGASVVAEEVVLDRDKLDDGALGAGVASL